MRIKASTIARLLNVSDVYSCYFYANDSDDIVWYVDSKNRIHFITDEVNDWLKEAIPSIKEKSEYFLTV